MNYLIETNIISEVRKGCRCDPNVARWYEKIDDASLYLSMLVIGEIRSDVERVRAKDTKKANALEQWLIAVDKAFGERILPIDRAVRSSRGNCQNPSHDAGDPQLLLIWTFGDTGRDTMHAITISPCSMR